MAAEETFWKCLVLHSLKCGVQNSYWKVILAFLNSLLKSKCCLIGKLYIHIIWLHKIPHCGTTDILYSRANLCYIVIGCPEVLCIFNLLDSSGHLLEYSNFCHKFNLICTRNIFFSCYQVKSKRFHHLGEQFCTLL